MLKGQHRMCSCFCCCAKMTVQLNEIWRFCSVRHHLWTYHFVAHPVQIQYLPRFSSFLVLCPLMTLLQLTEGLEECEKTILGHRTDFCPSFLCRNANPWDCKGKSRGFWLFPHVNPLHMFSPVAVLYDTQLPNIAIRELSHSHYFEYIIILAALSHPAHHHFSPFSLFWIDKSFMRREHQVTSIARFIGSWAFAYVVKCQSTSYSVLNVRSLFSQYYHLPKM